MRAAARALVWPLAAGISAARHARVLRLRKMPGGFPTALPASDSESGRAALGS